MKLKRALPILWLPLIGVWTFLFAVQSNSASTDLEAVVPFISYLVVSFLLVLQLQLVLGNKRESGIVKFGTANVLSICLSISSFSILLNLLKSIDNEVSIFLIVTPLIANTIIAEIFSASNKALVDKKKAWTETNRKLEEQQKKVSEENAQFRNKSIEYRKAWKSYLQQASIDYLDNSEIISEITRIKEIVEFSSYFRTKESIKNLSKIKANNDENQVLISLKQIK
ncbi:hypothetical protein [Prochlorococcus sp. MIT 1307]|uniref:hypothetical protein n=1 Tax=Prochlorococcus sp. MIT 1307 TaxID=3096219 RepID=UPI002A7492FE|nr:hypothetical protein [Prochlorococcus sp. MIT 1307]